MAGFAPDRPFAVEFEHADRLNAAFRVAPAAMKRAARQANAQVGREARSGLRSAASSGSAIERRMRLGIGSTSNSTSVTIAIRNTPARGRKPGGGTVGGAPGALGAFFGSYRYGNWVGSKWRVGVAGEGPRVLNPWIAAHEAQIEKAFLDGQVDAIAKTLPRF